MKLQVQVASGGKLGLGQRGASGSAAVRHGQWDGSTGESFTRQQTSSEGKVNGIGPRHAGHAGHAVASK